MKITFGKIDNLIIFGGSWLTAALIKLLSKKEINLLLYTSQRHYEDVVDSEGNTLGEVVTAAGVKAVVTNEINNNNQLLRDITANTLGISLGAAWEFEDKIVSLFDGRLVDFMGIDLPRYRGGAHYTWQILSNNRIGACNIQIIYSDPKLFHKGEILKRSEYLFPKLVRIPQDYFYFAIKKEISFLTEFLNEVGKKKIFNLSPLDESNSSYYPFLNAKIHGWINWGWTGVEIDRFICAFDEPYCGASAYLGNHKVFIKKCKYKRNLNFHPFHSGLIFRQLKGSIHVSVSGGELIIQSVVDDNGRNILNQEIEGMRFTTPNDKIELSLEFNANYGASGLE